MEHGPGADALISGADTLKQVSVQRCRGGLLSASQDWLAVELPIGLEYNGISHAVMLASPADLEDFALGFSLSEGIIANSSEFYGCEVEPRDDGRLVHVEIASERFMALKQRRRNLAGRTGCGLCGTEALEQVARELAPVRHSHAIAPSVLVAGMQAMQLRQPLQQHSGATHAAAWIDETGQVTSVREDVGRHNALDKLIGALAKQKTDFSRGALLLTSRASYEMVQKAATMGIGIIAAISAPTSFAVELADRYGVALIGFMRDTSYVVYTHSERFIVE
ncbi:MAG: formate dehydrogenase accessory sulfurtransferase FdhD [Oxalobacteraceae bacterium]|jgi:FdhD protein|nr:formate dehydrogenase accessory sulfurtransferase FdhD [Oxalobacteraceae bacterium]